MAVTRSAAPGGSGQGQPANWARLIGLVSPVLAAWLSWILTRVANPGQFSAKGFELFAAYAVIVQGLERVIEMGSNPPQLKEGASTSAAQQNANRTRVISGMTLIVGVIVTWALGLNLVAATGVSGIPRWLEIFASGVAVGAATKPLHDFLTRLQPSASG
jgi:uncharacterized protein YjeT (DUF2065 family)